MHGLWIDGVEPDEAVRRSGSKMGRLAELGTTGTKVPLAFAVTVDGFNEHFASTGLDEAIDVEMAGVDPTDHLTVELVADRIRGLVISTPIMSSLADEIVDAYEELCDRASDLNVPTAVRSSATGEDGSDSSFAGIFDTFLGVSGSLRVLEAVRACWASLFSPRAITYRARHGISHHAMPMAVGVVELVHARASGVAFSIHPVSGKTDRVVIESNWGWGEAVVQGLVTPDHFEVGKTDGRILKRTVNDKKVVSAFDFSAGHVTETQMPERLRLRSSLDDEQITAVAEAVIAIENHYGYPVDIEWVLDRHRRAGEPISIVQTRPVTVVEQAAVTGYDPMAMANKFIFSKGR